MANIELPKDAEGREIPLDTAVLYNKDGNELYTDRATYVRLTEDWWFFGHFGSHTDTHRIAAADLYLTPPDSWEKLLADLKRGASRVHHPECAYFGRDENDCDQCEAVCSFACKKIAFGDIESRIRKLMGEDQ